MEKYKTCTKCKQTKPIDGYPKKKSSPTGFASTCKDCTNARKRAWNAANKEKVSEMNRRSYLKNPSAYKDNARSWYLNNKEKAYQNARNYLAKNPGLANSYSHRRRTKLAQSETFEIRPSFLKRLYLSPCIYCGSCGVIEADHVIPIELNGRHSEGNLVPACVSCNRSKHDSYLIVWKIKKRGCPPTYK